MTIKIVVEQTCDRGGETRTLDNQAWRASQEHASQVGGWRQIDDKHLCPKCLREIFE